MYIVLVCGVEVAKFKTFEKAQKYLIECYGSCYYNYDCGIITE